MTVRLVIAEDSLLVREGLRSMLTRRAEIEVVAVCADLGETEAAIEEHRPDVVLTDIRMPPTMTDEGVRLAARLGRGTGVVVLSQYDDPEFALAVLTEGSRGRAYLLKERMSDPEQLVAAILAVAAGGSVVDPKIVDALVRGNRSPLDGLTPRERDVLAEMATGLDNQAIAAKLFLTVRAVEKHINGIFAKLGLSEEREVHRRVKAVLLHLAE
ncbi:response regulator transcription factor [Actinoplanes sp. NPDC051633]|uniref:response regulator transcription factor n=1 Tax=Actinoplanes sp. NPDC051633 TaxID=3155670 RepID=UPI003421AA40